MVASSAPCQTQCLTRPSTQPPCRQGELAVLCILKMNVWMARQPSSSERLSTGRLSGTGCCSGCPAAAASLHPSLCLPAPLGLAGPVQLGLEVWGALSLQPFPPVLLFGFFALLFLLLSWLFTRHLSECQGCP